MRKKDKKNSIRLRMFLAFGTLICMLLITSVISIVEYRRMSNSVSDMMDDNVRQIAVVTRMAGMIDNYNVSLLSMVGEESIEVLPSLDTVMFRSYCDSLKVKLTNPAISSLPDTLFKSFKRYVVASSDVKYVINSTWIDSKQWYFEKLQPVYQELRNDINEVNELIYEELKHNSANFDDGFYRSIIPGFVAVAACLVIVALLYFFISVYYVNPIYRISQGIDNYNMYSRPYGHRYDGDDQLANINTGVSELIDENIELKLRVNKLKRETNQ